MKLVSGSLRAALVHDREATMTHLEQWKLTILGATLAGIATLSSAPAVAAGTCTTVASGLESPLSLVQSNTGSLIVSESGTGAPNTGRISIVDENGDRRTLIDGLPSGISDVGDPSGPSGLFLRGRTLYAAMGVGDVGVLGRDTAGTPVPGSDVPNPDGPSSPIMSSVLALHFSADVERTASPYTLTLADHQALAAGQKVTLTNGAQQRITIELVTNFENYVPTPRPGVEGNVSLSNPYGIVGVGNRLYVTDGGRNLVWEVDTATGEYHALATSPNEPNPFFGTVGGPTTQAVPTGIAYSGGALLVTLFRGAPFPATGSVESIDLLSGAGTRLIADLKTPIGVMPITSRADKDYLVLQFSSGMGPFFGGPGEVLRFAQPDATPAVVADCLTAPTAMVVDRKAGALYVTDLTGGVVSMPLQ
jgi:hypothetical protein